MTDGEPDLAEADTVLAGSRAGKSLRAIAVDIYGREQVDADRHADSGKRAKLRRRLGRAGYGVMPRGVVCRQGEAVVAPFVAHRRISRVALPAGWRGSCTDGGWRLRSCPVQRRYRVNPPPTGS